MKIHKSTRLHDENNIREVGRFSKLYRAMVTIEVVCRKKKKRKFLYLPVSKMLLQGLIH